MVREVVFIIIRHGITPANKDKVIQGQLPGKLSKEGVIQSEQLRLRLHSLHSKCNSWNCCQAFYVSDLVRTLQTGAIVSSDFECFLEGNSSSSHSPSNSNSTSNSNSNSHSNSNSNERRIEVIYEKRLREKNGGVLQGSPAGTPYRRALEKGIPYREFRAEGAENWSDVTRRAIDWFSEALLRFSSGEDEEEREIEKEKRGWDRKSYARVNSHPSGVRLRPLVPWEGVPSSTNKFHSSPLEKVLEEASRKRSAIVFGITSGGVLRELKFGLHHPEVEFEKYDFAYEVSNRNTSLFVVKATPLEASPEPETEKGKGEGKGKGVEKHFKLEQVVWNDVEHFSQKLGGSACQGKIPLGKIETQEELDLQLEKLVRETLPKSERVNRQ